MIDRFGTRLSSMVGSFLGSLGLLMASLSRNIIQMNATFGFVTGKALRFVIGTENCIAYHLYVLSKELC